MAAGLGSKTLKDGNRRAVGQFVEEHKQYLTGRVLDFGCGLQPYKAFVTGEYVGYDPGYCDHLSRPSGLFDAILITQVLQFTDDPREMLHWLRDNHLSVGGYFVITYHTSWYEAQGNDTWRITREGMERLLRGCEIIVHKPVTELVFDNFVMRLTYGVVVRKLHA